MSGNIRSLDEYDTTIKTRTVGPLRITAYSKVHYPKKEESMKRDYPRIEQPLAFQEEIEIPLATYEEPLYICVNRGAKVSRAIEGGIKVYVEKDLMTRAPVIKARDIKQALDISDFLKEYEAEIADIVESTTGYGKFLSIKPYAIGNDVYVRLAMQCGDAAGHNMTTKAATRVTRYLLERFPDARYISDSGNVCTDKKSAAINAITGRGKSVITEIIIPRVICKEHLKTTPEKITELNITKNLQGSIAAGTLFSANAHYANIIAAMYLATGQDLANIVEGSFGITQASTTEQGDLEFRTTMPCLIVGTYGSGKNGESQKRSLEILGCAGEKTLGFNSQRLAAIIAGATAVGELSLLATQTTPGELIESHERIERK